MGPVVREGIRSKWIIDITHLFEAPEWLRWNTGTNCPTCSGTGGVMVALNDAQPGEILHLAACPCPHCRGRGEVSYVSTN